jgi:thiol-disulfide isomerase/thioredoxin
VRRWPPVVIGTVAALVALAAAVGAGAVARSLEDDEPRRPEPEVELSFDGSDDESAQDDLIGGDVAGEPAPDVSFALLEGGTLRLADLRGTPVVVNFFATWCTPCVKEMPAFEQVHQELGDDVAFVGIDVRDSVSGAQELVERTGVTYTIGRDPSGEIFQDFDAVNMPSTFLLAADGTVVASHAGALDAGGLRDLVAEHLPS